MEALIDRIEAICKILNSKQVPQGDEDKLLAELEQLLLDVRQCREQRDKRLNMRL